MAGKKNARPKEKIAGIPVRVMRTRKYAALSAWAVRLLLEFVSQYNLYNNGDLMAAFSVLRERGFHSKGTLNRAIKELIEGGFIVRTRQGGKNKCYLYAITWQPIDECLDKQTRRSKLEISPSTVPLGTWKDEKLGEAKRPQLN